MRLDKEIGVSWFEAMRTCAFGIKGSIFSEEVQNFLN